MIRDTWGVPHVVSEDETAAMYAFGYAQAEDRLEDIYLAVRTGLGRMAEVQGPSALEQDYMMRLAHNDTLHAEYLKQAPEQVRKNLEAFTSGIRAYIAEHPQEACERKQEVHLQCNNHDHKTSKNTKDCPTHGAC